MVDKRIDSDTSTAAKVAGQRRVLLAEIDVIVSLLDVEGLAVLRRMGCRLLAEQENRPAVELRARRVA
jgi:hypothetical protein